jgi:hypothetical protein
MFAFHFSSQPVIFGWSQVEQQWIIEAETGTGPVTAGGDTYFVVG